MWQVDRSARRAWDTCFLYVSPSMGADTPHHEATNQRVGFRGARRRKWLTTVLALAVLLAWPLGLLDWRTWQHGYREWRVERKIRVGMLLRDVLAVMPSPTRTAGHAGTQYVEFENGEIVVLLDFHERVSQVTVKRPGGPGTPNWLIGAVFTLLAGCATYLWRRDRPPPTGHCPVCAYDLRGNVSGRCPECGTAMGAQLDRGSERPTS
jgi:hypothetical protein